MARGYSRIVSLGPQTRVLHFASYAFDASIIEVLPTLMAGGCICILSELERRDRLTETIATLQPCQATLTPSVLRAISPADMASVRTVIAAGEPLRESDIQQWAPYVDLFNGYGPAEAAIIENGIWASGSDLGGAWTVSRPSDHRCGRHPKSGNR